MADRTRIFLRRHGNPDGPRLVMSHGNGLAIDLYYPFWSLLTDDFDVVIYDLRNHGWNAVTDLKEHTIPTLIDDHDLVIDCGRPPSGRETEDRGVSFVLSPWRRCCRPQKAACSRPSSCSILRCASRARATRRSTQRSKRASASARRRSRRFRSRERLRRAPADVAGLQKRRPGNTRSDGEGRRSARRPMGMATCCGVLPSTRPRSWTTPGFSPYRSTLGALQCPTKVIGADPTLPFSYLPTMDLSDMLSVDYDLPARCDALAPTGAPGGMCGEDARVHRTRFRVRRRRAGTVTSAPFAIDGPLPNLL